MFHVLHFTRLSRPVIILSLVVFGLSVQAQHKERTFIDAEAAFYEEEFLDAMTLYNKVIEIDPKYKDAKYKVEICSLLQKEHREKSLDEINKRTSFKSFTEVGVPLTRSWGRTTSLATFPLISDSRST